MAKTPRAAAPSSRRSRTTQAAANRAVERADTGTLKRGEVLGRDGEVLSRARSTGYRNDFDLPEHVREDGWDYQWVRQSCHGKPDPANVNAHMENGWRPAAGKRLTDHYRAAGDHIERDGLILMERPQALTNEAIAEDRRNAVELKQAQAEQFGARKLPDGFDEGGIAGDGRFDARRKIRREIVGAPTALLPERQIAIGDDD
jgi:hypothetical protein